MKSKQQPCWRFNQLFYHLRLSSPSKPHHQCRYPGFCEPKFVNGLITHATDVLQKETKDHICEEVEKEAMAKFEAKIAVRVREWMSTLSKLAKECSTRSVSVRLF